MIIYTDKFMPDWMGGRQFWFIALVRPQHRGKQDLVEHEREHIAQWCKTTLIAYFALFFASFVAHKHMSVALIDLLPLLVVAPSVHGFLYMALRNYRQWAEVAAYRVSLSYRPDQLDHYANVLATKYKLKLSIEEAKQLLSR